MNQITANYAQAGATFVPADFEVPQVLQSERFRLRMLTVNDLQKDFDAVTSSVRHLQTIWRTDWPLDLTLEQNLIDLGWHQKEFQRRRSFTYTVLSPDESLVLGCVYIYPASKTGFDAEVYFWSRRHDHGNAEESRLEIEFENRLGAGVKSWLESKWPFRNVAFPGRVIAWADWDAMI